MVEIGKRSKLTCFVGELADEIVDRSVGKKVSGVLSERGNREKTALSCIGNIIHTPSTRGESNDAEVVVHELILFCVRLMSYYIPLLQTSFKVHL
jgi:hypothetical protein